jgi:hypothetical protein
VRSQHGRGFLFFPNFLPSFFIIACGRSLPLSYVKELPHFLFCFILEPALVASLALSLSPYEILHEIL